ncbi:MAG: YggT family protein [Treponemataceae bacterium]
MEFLTPILKTLASIISIYSTMCFIRIVLTWIPSLSYSPVTKFLSQICDPFLNLFSKTRLLRFHNIDFSPILAFAVLSGISQILLQIASTGKLSVAYTLVTIINLAWGIVNSIIVMLIIVLLIRLVFLFINRPGNNFQIWNAIDSIVYSMTNPMVNIFAKGKFISLKLAIFIAIAESVIVFFAGSAVIKIICRLIFFIPF